jgi:hypothetical protein
MDAVKLKPVLLPLLPMLYAYLIGITASGVPGYTKTEMKVVIKYTVRHTLKLLVIDL